MWFGLSQNDEVDRRLALEEIALNPLTSQLLDRLAEIARSDPAPACRDDAARILAAHRARESAKQILPTLQLSPETLNTFLEDAEPALRRAILRSLRNPPPDGLLDLWRNDLLQGSSLERTEAALIVLTRFGKPADAVFALGFLGGEQPEIVRAALDLLLAQNPELFKESLASTLASGQTEVRLHAVRLLRNIDPDEALAYLESLVRSEDPLLRLKALHELLLLPFSVAEPAYLRFLGAETRPLLLVLVSLAVAFNPHPDLPLKVYDILLVSRGPKKAILQAGFNQLLECIQQAGILTLPIGEYVASLKEDLTRRRETLLITLAIKDLADPEAETRRGAVDRLRPSLARPEVAQALETRLALESDEEIRTLLAFLVGQASPVPAEGLAAGLAIGLAEAVTGGSFPTLPLARQQSLVRALNRPDLLQAARPQVRELLAGKTHRVVLLELIHLVGEFGEPDDVPALAPLLRQGEPAVIAAAIKACGKLDLDSLLPTLNKLLQEEDPRVKAAALEVFLRSDKEGAIRYLAAMARSPHPAIRRQALHLFPLLDYSSAEPLLVRMFADDPQDGLKIQAGFMIAANPSLPGLETIYRGCFDEKGERREGFGELWESAVQGASEVLHQESAALQEHCVREVAKKRQAEKAPSPSYAFRKVVGQAPYASPASPAPARLNLRHFAALILIVVPLGYLAFFPAAPRFDSGAAMEETTGSGGSAPTAGPSSGMVGLRSNARAVLGGPAYARLMKGGADECREYSQRTGQKRLERLAGRAAGADVPVTERLGAVAAVHPLISQARADLDQKKFPEAREAFAKVAQDPAASPMERVLAQQGLIGISAQSGEKLQDLAGNIDGFMKEFVKLPGNETMPVVSFQADVRQVTSSMEVFQDAGKKRELGSKLSEVLAIDPAEAGKRVNGMFEVLAGGTDGGPRP